MTGGERREQARDVGWWVLAGLGAVSGAYQAATLFPRLESLLGLGAIAFVLIGMGGTRRAKDAAIAISGFVLPALSTVPLWIVPSYSPSQGVHGSAELATVLVGATLWVSFLWSLAAPVLACRLWLAAILASMLHLWWMVNIAFLAACTLLGQCP